MNKNLKFIVIISSLISIVLGGFGMLYCAQFLWSAKIEDLVGAGFPFVGGSILFSSGLIALSNLYKKEN